MTPGTEEVKAARDGRVDQRIQRLVSEEIEHRDDIVRRRTDVARNKARRIGETARR